MPISELTRVNIRSVVNMTAIREEKRNGKDVIIVPSATLPDDIVMNGIKYPADEIKKSYATLEGTPAPYGHPKANGKFIAANSCDAMDDHWFGARNENVRRANGRVFLDKVIRVDVANRTDQGKAVLNAIEKGEPIHTSTGLLCELEPCDDGTAKHIARNIHFDHDAVLLNEDGAATPDQGVGMLVNGQEIEVINSSAEDAMRDLDWSVDSAMRAMDKLKNAPRHERFKQALLTLFGLSEDANPTGQLETNTMADDKELNELSAKVDALTTANAALPKTIANAVKEAMKPITDTVEAMQANQKEKDEAELSGLREKIVKANIMDEDTAKELTLNTARKLAERAAPGKAAAINGAFTGNSADDEWSGYDMNAAIKAEKKEAA